MNNLSINLLVLSKPSVAFLVPRLKTIGNLEHCKTFLSCICRLGGFGFIWQRVYLDTSQSAADQVLCNVANVTRYEHLSAKN